MYEWLVARRHAQFPDLGHLARHGAVIHKQWSDRTRKWYISLKDKPQKRAWTFAGWFITFHFVVLGWVWFALPDFDSAVQVFGKLVGM